MSEKEPTYQERVWQKNAAGELEYIGPDTLELVFNPPLSMVPNDPEPLQSITLKEPTAKHLSAFMQAQRKHDDVEATIMFIAANSGAMVPKLRQMRSRDFAKASEFLSGFTPPEPKAGA